MTHDDIGRKSRRLQRQRRPQGSLPVEDGPLEIPQIAMDALGRAAVRQAAAETALELLAKVLAE